MEIRLLNTDPAFNDYYMQALDFDNNHSWILDTIDEESLFWDIEEMRFSSYSFGLFDNDKLIGLSLVNFEFDDNDSLIYDFSIIIDPKYRKKGIGYMFSCQVLDLVNKKYKVNSINAHVKSNNIGSISLLSKLGFDMNGTEDSINLYSFNFDNDLNKKKVNN